MLQIGETFQYPKFGFGLFQQETNEKWKQNINKLASLEATLVRNYDPLTDSQGWSVELLA